MSSYEEEHPFSSGIEELPEVSKRYFSSAEGSVEVPFNSIGLPKAGHRQAVLKDFS